MIQKDQIIHRVLIGKDEYKNLGVAELKYEFIFEPHAKVQIKPYHQSIIPPLKQC